MVLKILSIVFSIVLCNLSANSIILTKETPPFNILKQTQIYIDKENKTSFNFIQHNNSLFQQNNKELIHLGYSPDAVWLKFSIKNGTNLEIKKVL